ncbi:uncharacterized protein PHACADRAFT_207814 [Phanerochaete carnosa HHB-10118-sp]|uniref:DUF6533 domain-containing protein n=1 Tax=Phanerochaete carnosa (strain HHB-10118-sp) TaxID=650164 RepID=K5V258_PHACS|nr:uncharacterized protein PHACADRAFT_207814 [Phanerochaete carnosa HHB-10118-sp]EKM56611.1 hypothetical protein PHACADRAFT_207814 [Phanerochaete carnosa HHB-10118-sp]
MRVPEYWSVAEVTIAFRDARLSRSLNILPFVILYYDYLLTLPTEIERYWTADLSPRRGPVWFLFCRYLSLVGNVPVLMRVAWPLDDHRFSLVRHRTPAPEEPAAIGCNVATSSAMGYITDILPCSSDLAITWSAMLCHDIMIFTLTLYKALSLRGGSRTIVDVLLRDGTMYFGLFNEHYASYVPICTSKKRPPMIKGITATFTNILSTTLIARLMLNIRDPKIIQQTRYSNSPVQRTTSTVSDDPIVTSALDTAGQPEWTEFNHELTEIYQDEGETPYGTRHDVIELVQRDHPPEKSKGKAWRAGAWLKYQRQRSLTCAVSA